jgi:uncharacterized protein (DUF3820 family)
MPFGKYRGKRLDDIASTDDGLKYLDWAVGEFRPGNVRDFIERYLRDETIREELDALMEEEQ